MNIEKLYNIQRELDQKIVSNHQLQKDNLVPAKLLALQVELGELANETRCFKYWSLRPASEKEVILEEFVDGLHFVLSIGLDLSFDKDVIQDFFLDSEEEPMVELQDIDEGSKTKNKALEGFLEVYALISAVHQEASVVNYKLLLKKYIQLGYTLGFQWAAIGQAYLSKNEVNHQRQAEGY
ncbi:dUTP diphosphatase [Bacillus horti]|uniref:Dimeric dUTPase (All-alpha-NTP-PPase superfamily) n=1 Tax=Caldalkalibacillus horti TaxID=77523 RepID=A0ABT9VW27_9BACI|nr:dUTP diphosphatase [Bacillus horti]MDQ0165193.1 dimeric dUTPase (all-alpha-NTP-PPase superfamily) [Bacillus horti]